MAGSQYLVVDLSPSAIVQRLKTVEGPLAGFQQVTVDMLLGATFLCVDPTHWLSQEVRLALGRSVASREILEWLWGTKAPTHQEQMTIIRHVGAELERRFENYKAMHVFLPTFAKTAVPESLVSPRATLAPRGTFSDGSSITPITPTAVVVVTDAPSKVDG